MSQKEASSNKFINRLHYKPIRKDYSISPHELDNLKELCESQCRNYCLFLVGLGLPCLLNAVADTKTPFELSLILFLNYLVSGISLSLAIFFGHCWHKNNKKSNKLFQSIKDCPSFDLEFRTSNTNISNITTDSEKSVSSATSGSGSIILNEEK